MADITPYDMSSILGGYGLLNPQPASTPAYQTFTAPLSNKGNPTSRINKQDNSFAVMQGAPIRLIDYRTGQVAYEGTGYEGAQEAIKIAQNLSNTYGKKASWDIQTATPDTGSWTTLAHEKKNKSPLGIIADIALPIAGSFIPGVGPILGAAIGSGASSVAQGRSLENTLLRAGLAAGGSALGGAIFGNAAGGATGPTVGSNLPSWGAMVAPLAAQGAGTAAGSALGAGIGSVAPSAAGDIIVTALSRAAPSAFGSAIGSGFGSYVAPNLLDAISSPAPSSGDITVTAKQPTNILPSSFLTPDAIAASAAANALGATQSPQDLAASRTSMTPEELAAINSGAGGSGLLAGLTKNMSLMDYLTAGSLAAGALGSAFGKGTGSSAGTPYVSPFGAGPTFGAGTDLRANPNIADYEKYGFGPEAAFFQPEYNRLVSGATQPKSTATPTYTPLLNG